MTEITRIGVDTSKAVFTLHCVDEKDRPVLRLNLRRGQFLGFFRKQQPAIVALEACGSSYHWARELTALGHTVRLLPPQYVKPYVKRGKNDQKDAEAICEAAGRPGMHFVPTKTLEQQADGMVLKARDMLIGQRTALINTVRGHAAEFGLITAKGAANVEVLFPAIEQQSDIPLVAKEMFAMFRQQISDINERIAELDARVNAMHKTSALSRRLATIPGVGPITALTLTIEIDGAVRIRPPPRRVGGTDTQGPLDRRQATVGCDHPGRQRDTAPPAGLRRHSGDPGGQQAGQPADDGVAARSARPQAAQARGRGTRQQDGPYRLGAHAERRDISARRHPRGRLGVAENESDQNSRKKVHVLPSHAPQIHDQGHSIRAVTDNPCAWPRGVTTEPELPHGSGRDQARPNGPCYGLGHDATRRAAG